MKIVDLHCDTISHLYKTGGSLLQNQAQYDIERARSAKVCLQFFALFTMPADSNTCLRQILKQMEKFLGEMGRNPEHVYHITNRNDWLEEDKLDKLGCILHLEGAECLGTDIEILRLLYHGGLRSMGLTWNHRNLLADGGGEGDNAGGLSRKGREVLREMERLGIMLDLSHIAPKSYFEALDLYSKPVLVTHANTQALCPHWRNLDDTQLRVLAEHGGVLGITQVADFIREGQASIDDMLNHIVYAADLIGVEHVALGSDFDGADNMVIGNVKGYAELPELLAGKGFTPTETEMILSGNALRVIMEII